MPHHSSLYVLNDNRENKNILYFALVAIFKKELPELEKWLSG